MRLGIVADIHEDAEKLALALRRFRGEGVDRVVCLGDVAFALGSGLHETVALLADAGAVGVWGNHDLGLCHEPDEHFKRRFAGPVGDFMATLRPRLELAGCLFTHGLPYQDPTDPVAYYLGERPETAEGLAQSFAASDHPVLFVGHFHRWLIASPQGPLAWDGTEPILLRPDRRYLVVVAAVCDGWCAVFDADSRVLTPCRLVEAVDGPARAPAEVIAADDVVFSRGMVPPLPAPPADRAEAGAAEEAPPAVADDSPLRDPLLELEQEFQDQQEEGKL